MNEEIFWRAVKENDKRFDGVVFTCVTSTKIFCKPSCTARLPKRENVFFVDTQKSAENKGFRACLRCRPNDINGVDDQVKTVVKACELMETAEDGSLESLAEKLNLSASHFQRTFKKIIGISPKKYSEKRRLEKFKSEIKKGSEVTEAMYEAGFGSSSRLYEKASDNLGMTPATYKKGGTGARISFAVADCTLGQLLVARTEKGLCGLKFGDKEQYLVKDLEAEYPNAEINRDNKGLKKFIEVIIGYLNGKRQKLDLPLDVYATAFQMRVWDALRKIPYGETLSYSEVAEKIGNKKAVRAVASACAKNQVALVIPCHRVIGSDGKMSGYRWGIERKKQILETEGRKK